LNAVENLGATPDVVDALAQEGAHGPLIGRVDVGWGNEIAAQEVGEFFRIDAVVLVLAAVNGAQVEGVGQNEGETRLVARIGQPVPAEHAFAADGEVVLVGFDALEEELEVVVFDVGVDQLFSLAVHDADVHLPCVEIDSAVELSGGGVILHNC